MMYMSVQGNAKPPSFRFKTQGFQTCKVLIQSVGKELAVGLWVWASFNAAFFIKDVTCKMIHTKSIRIY